MSMLTKVLSVVMLLTCGLSLLVLASKTVACYWPASSLLSVGLQTANAPALSTALLGGMNPKYTSQANLHHDLLLHAAACCCTGAQGVSGPFINVDVQGPYGAEVGRSFSVGCPTGSFVTGFTLGLATSSGKDVLVALLGPSVECSSDGKSTSWIQTAARLQLPTHRNITIYPMRRSDGFSGVTLHHGQKYVNAVSLPPARCRAPSGTVTRVAARLLLWHALPDRW
jgi:hypothetical protein